MASRFATGFSGGPKIKIVYCQMGTYVHGDKTKGEDDALCIVEFENDAVGIIEDSWASAAGWTIASKCTAKAE